MRKKIIYSLFILAIFVSCKKKAVKVEKSKIEGVFYKNCNDVASNTTYYIVYPITASGSNEPIPILTDINGYFSFEEDKNADMWYNISADKNINNAFCHIEFHGENLNVGILRESANNQLVLKLKTNHVLSNLDTIKYVFQYGNFQAPIYGPILKDTIIGFYNMNITSPNSNSNVELKTLWWNFGQTTSSNQVRIDYTIHGCASVVDTAYIIVP